MWRRSEYNSTHPQDDNGTGRSREMLPQEEGESWYFQSEMIYKDPVFRMSLSRKNFRIVVVVVVVVAGVIVVVVVVVVFVVVVVVVVVAGVVVVVVVAAGCDVSTS